MNEPHLLIGGTAALTIAPDRPTLWLMSLDDQNARMRAEWAPLTDTDYRAMAPYRDAGERLVRRRLTKLLLAAAAGITPAEVAIGRTEEGAARVLSPSGWHVSVAARWPDCAIAVANIRIGVDVERITDDPSTPDLLTEAERTWMATLHPGLRAASFAQCWAAKEAHAKWTGTPRMLDPASIAAGDADVVRSPLGDTHCWRRFEGTLAMAVCTGGG